MIQICIMCQIFINTIFRTTRAFQPHKHTVILSGLMYQFMVIIYLLKISFVMLPNMYTFLISV